MDRRRFLKNASAAATGAGIIRSSKISQSSGRFRSMIPQNTRRTFIGPEFWANRLQDWGISDGRIECLDKRETNPMRTLHLLTHQLDKSSSDFEINVRMGLIDEGEPAGNSAAGLLVGAGGGVMDYRAAALIHDQPGPGGGLLAGCDPSGRTFFRDFEKVTESPATAVTPTVGEINLELTGHSLNGQTTLTLIASDASGRELSRTAQTLDDSRLTGNIALFSHPGTGESTSRFWFRDWQVAGRRVAIRPERAWGPILSTLYTVHDRVLKLTAQLAPVGESESQTAFLQVRSGKNWRTVARTAIQKSGWTAPFRVEKWNTSRDVTFRVRYDLKGANGVARPHYRQGIIRRDPVDKETLVLASLSCVQQIDGAIGQRPTYDWKHRVWFPHTDLTPNLADHNADLYFFAGDQIYEGNPTRVVRSPLDEAELDYLYKWYLWCWAFGEIVRDTPCICIPDDHDVYHGNIWGMGGRASAADDPAGLLGGYGMPPRWLNMIQRTQTSHLPDPYDPTPVEQSVGVYYTKLVLGEIGFAILEDRKFKSSPAVVAAKMTPDSHIIDKNYDTREADMPGATLLGQRQLKFLYEFSKDWRGQQMKAALSQTIFCNLQISSRPPTTGELDKDLDSNGWPQSGRNAALRELRRGFMIHLAGDQHLASAIRHGIDDFGDACWSQCSPAIANLYPRFWNPDYPPVNPGAELKPFMGDYEDGFHNRITVHAVANPVNDPQPGQFPDPVDLHRKATGYNIIRFDKSTRTITLETWPRHVNPRNGKQYDGWPIKIAQTDNYGRKAVAWLPTLKVEGMSDPVVQVVEKATDEVLYSMRIKGTEFRPKVFAVGKYTIHVGEPGTHRIKTFVDVESISVSDQSVIRINL